MPLDRKRASEVEDALGDARRPTGAMGKPETWAAIFTALGTFSLAWFPDGGEWVRTAFASHPGAAIAYSATMFALGVLVSTTLVPRWIRSLREVDRWAEEESHKIRVEALSKALALEREHEEAMARISVDAKRLQDEAYAEWNLGGGKSRYLEGLKRRTSPGEAGK